MATCYRHPGRETAVACSNCGRPICPDCMTSSPVGMRCPECARHTTKVRKVRATRTGGYEATLVLIAINVIVFLVEGSGVFSFGNAAGSSKILNDGDLWGPNVSGQNYLASHFHVAVHEYYRLLTSGFLHLDILHILFNMYVLYWVGRLLEPAIGRSRFLAIYFTGLLAGSLGVLIASPHTPTAGASGAIFGLMAAAFTEAHQRGVDMIRNQLLGLIAINLIISLSLPGISIGAHVGGLIGGGLATLGFQQGDRMRAAPIGYAICGVLSVAAVAGALLIAHGTNYLTQA